MKPQETAGVHICFSYMKMVIKKSYRILLLTSKVPCHIVPLDVCKVRMQSHKLSCTATILYHWLRLHKFPSPALFFLNYMSFSYTPYLLTSAHLLESWSPLFLSLLLLNFCPTSRNFCLLFLLWPSFWNDPSLYSPIPLTF